MKKLIALVLIFAFLLCLIGCKQTVKNEVSGAESELQKETMPQADPSEWGLTLEAENVTATGLTILCQHAGGENVAELNTGSYYVIQRSEETGWVDVEYLPHEYEICWTAEAWIIQKEGTTQWDVKWDSLYGELPAGDYRIGKEIMNFRYAGNYDEGMLYAEFTIR